MRELINIFNHTYGESSESIRIFFAPGRVNLIGEHIDYNGGNVLPCALEIGTYLLARKRTDHKLLFYSLNFKEVGIIEKDLNELTFSEEDSWVNYPKGIFAEIGKKHSLDEGMDLLFYGNIPNGAGLSSSASIELVTSVLINEWYQLGLSQLELVKTSQWVENEFIGVNCGIMDQFSIGFGKNNHAILLNCQSLEYKYLPLNLEGYRIVIANTNKQRTLAGSAYNERRATCDQALNKIQATLQVDSLADIAPHQFDIIKESLTEIEVKRVRHVVMENARTVESVDVLLKGDLIGFGELMKKSHNSLRDDYEVSCLELDTLVEAAWKHTGTIGARMTGAGFGGCTVNIVKESETNSFIEYVGKEYLAQVGYEASFYVVRVGEGAKELQPAEWDQLNLIVS